MSERLMKRTEEGKVSDAADKAVSTEQTVLDLYRSGQRAKKSLWDVKTREKPLPYLHSKRGKRIALEKAQIQIEERKEREKKGRVEVNRPRGDLIAEGFNREGAGFGGRERERGKIRGDSRGVNSYDSYNRHRDYDDYRDQRGPREYGEGAGRDPGFRGEDPRGFRKRPYDYDRYHDSRIDRGSGGGYRERGYGEGGAPDRGAGDFRVSDRNQRGLPRLGETPDRYEPRDDYRIRSQPRGNRQYDDQEYDHKRRRYGEDAPRDRDRDRDRGRRDLPLRRGGEGKPASRNNDQLLAQMNQLSSLNNLGALAQNNMTANLASMVTTLPQQLPGLENLQQGGGLNQLANPLQLAQLNQLLALQNGLLNSTALSGLGMGQTRDGSTQESQGRPAAREEKVQRRRKTQVQFPRFSLLPVEGTYVPNLYPYYCFLSEIIEVAAPKLKIKDIRGEERIIRFANDTEMGSFASVPRTFNWSDLSVGKTIAIMQAKATTLTSGMTKGIVVDKAKLENVYVFDDNLANVCNTVLKLSMEKVVCFHSACQTTKMEALEPCGNCNLAVYCSEGHQRKSWFDEGHDKLCSQTSLLNRVLRTEYTDPAQFNFARLLDRR